MSKHLEKARDCVKKKNYEYAVHWYITHLKAEPADLEARKELRNAERAQKKMSGGGGLLAKAKAKLLEAKVAGIRVNTKDPEKTVIQCEEVLKEDPDNVPALLRLGEAASYANLNEVAINAFEDALTSDKNCKEAYRLMGRVYKGMEEMEKALKCFRQLERLDPKDSEAIDACKNIPAMMTAAKVKEGVDKGGYQNLIDQDEAAKLERQSARIRTPEQALERIADLEPKLKADPYDIKTMKVIIDLYLKAEQPDEALGMCERALKVDEHEAQIWEMRGNILMDRYKEQVQKYEAAVKKNPAYKDKLAKAKQDLLGFEIQEYKRRVEAAPTEYGTRFLLGKAYFDAGQVDEAIPELQQAKSDARRKSEAGYFLGRCYLNKKIYKLAVNELAAAREELEEMNELKKDITYLLGRIYEQANKKDKAIAEYEQIAVADFNYRDVTKRLEALSSL